MSEEEKTDQSTDHGPQSTETDQSADNSPQSTENEQDNKEKDQKADDSPEPAGNENASELQTTNHKLQTEEMGVHHPHHQTTDDSPEPAGNENASELQTTNHKLQTEEMEVHHSHHPAHKKKWTEYLLEFFMLFLAVFLGFIAENIREHYVEKEKEKQYIESLIADLKTDQQVLSQNISNVKAGILMMDSLISIVNNPSQIAGNTGQLYYLARLAPRLNPLSNNTRTFDQLKNSGNFRLISNLTTSDKIMSYYEKFPLLRLLESINETEFTEYKKTAAKILDPAVLVSMEGSGDQIVRTVENPPLRTFDNETLQELSVFAVYMHGTKKGVLNADEKLKTAGTELITYLQKEYHLENE